MNMLRSVLAWFALSVGQAAAAATLYVGQVVPLTGPAASVGQALSQGAAAYVARVNAEGQLGSHRLELLSRDDAFQPDRTLLHARQLIDEHGVLALLNVVGAPNNGGLHEQGLLRRSDVSVVGAFTGSTSVRALRSPHLYFIRAGVADEARLIARQLTALGITRVALLRADDAFGADAASRLAAEFRERAIALSAEERYAPASIDVDGAAQRFRAMDLQAIVAFGTPRAASELMLKYRKAGGGALFILSSASSADAVVDNVGADVARGTGLVQVVPPVSKVQLPIVQEYLATLAKYGPPAAKPTATGLEGFIAAKLLVQAIRRAGDSPTPARVSAALSGLGSVNVGGFIIDMSPARHSSVPYADIGIIGLGGRLRN